ncbi:unnamed protein product, partial [Tilletia caries]
QQIRREVGHPEHVVQSQHALPIFPSYLERPCTKSCGVMQPCRVSIGTKVRGTAPSPYWREMESRPLLARASVL